MVKKKDNIYKYIVLKVLLAFGVMMLMQVLFHLANGHILRPEDSNEWTGLVLGNIVFGMATLATLLLPWFVMMLLPSGIRWCKGYRIVSECLYIVGVALFIIPRAANTAYYQFTYRLLSDEIFSYLGIGGNMGALLPLFAVDYWYAWVPPLLLFIAFLFINSKIKLKPRESHRMQLIQDSVGSVVGGLLVWFLLRGGFGSFISTRDAAQYVQPKNSALVVNDTYNILRTLFTPDLEEVNYMPADEAERLFPCVTRGTGTIEEPDTVKRNVVLIVVESLGQEYMGCYNSQSDADTRTPFLDSLARYSTLYDGRANGKKSIEGITAINTSIPNLMDRPFTNSAYDSDHYTGLPAVMKRHGYHTAFFHGTYNGVMDFDRIGQRIGFDEYLGENEYTAWRGGEVPEEEHDGAWGILDEPFLHYTVEKLNSYREPFFAEVFTVSSHHPYPMPKKYRDRFTEGQHPILKCIEYTDHALRQFFEEARRQPWYKNTLFVIVGDHSGQGLSDEYNDYDGWYRIPVIFYDPQQPRCIRSPRIVQQTDLYPTLVDMMGFADEGGIVAFGQSIVRSPDRGWQVYYGNGYYCMVSNNAVVPEGHDITVICGDYRQGKPENIRFLEAIIQQYNNRIINDKLITI